MTGRHSAKEEGTTNKLRIIIYILFEFKFNLPRYIPMMKMLNLNIPKVFGILIHRRIIFI